MGKHEDKRAAHEAGIFSSASPVSILYVFFSLPDAEITTKKSGFYAIISQIEFSGRALLRLEQEVAEI
jgi:hypothetical protein